MKTASRDIAIVGMGLALPGAQDPVQFWENLRDGIESIADLSIEELEAAGETQARLGHPDYVRRAALLRDYDRFDAEFFGLSPKDAAIMDPQHRKFLEVCWHALENAGHRPDSLGSVGVWAGCGVGSYFSVNICSNRDLVEETGMFLLRHTGNDKDFLSTRASFVFDLHGPSVNVQTACSTSLVAVHKACQSLLTGECDAALAGGVTVELPQGRGYLYKPNEILSPDGHCRAFDHRSEGTVFGSGAAVVLLRRLEDALADGDHVWAVIRGSAVNNDGAAKAGYLAPSVTGQATAIAEAHLVAGVDASSIDYVECHGTGTRLGDPIEIAALTEAFSLGQGQGCAGIGSVKTNIGHTDTAAGTAGLIKVALSLHHGQMPPSLGFEAPNPIIDFASTPFHVVSSLSAWPRHQDRPARAAVNSLGVGGTNAHVVLEAAPARPASEASDWPMLPLVVSGRSRAALDANAAALAAWLRRHPDTNLADVGFTLQQGRKVFDKRRVLVAQSPTEAAEILEKGDTRRVFNHDRPTVAPAVTFLFPGGGAQSIYMARDLYETEPVFRDWMERGLSVLERLTGHDPRPLWLPPAGQEAQASAAMTRPSIQLPLIMIVEYALAQLWISWGVQPAALAGHSMGENTAACLAGVFSFEDSIALVTLRGQLFDRVAPGGMLSLPLPLDEARAEAGPDLDIAVRNAEGLSVVSGPRDLIDALQVRLTARGIESQRIAIDVAAHSRMLDPILPEFEAFLRGITLNAPGIPLLSNRTGTWMTAAQATDPVYWVEHLRHAVDFQGCIATLRQDPTHLFIEVGPGRAMAQLAQANGTAPDRIVSSLRHTDQAIGDDAFFLQSFARLWAAGVDLDWQPIWGEGRHRVPLPGYVFQTKRYFIEPATGTAATPAGDDTPLRLADPAEWGWRPAWHLSAANVELDEGGRPVAAPSSWLILCDGAGLGAEVAARLRAQGHSVMTLRPGDRFTETGEGDFTVAPENGAGDFDLLVVTLTGQNRLPRHIVSFWLVPDAHQDGARAGFSPFHRHVEQGFNTLLHLVRALANDGGDQPVDLVAVTSGAARIGSEPVEAPEKALILGPLGVGPREFPWLSARSIDIDRPKGAAARAAMADRLIEDLCDPAPPARVSWRDGRRYSRRIVATSLPQQTLDMPAFGPDDTVLITGGLGGIGMTLARWLVLERKAKVALLVRSPLPPAEEWEARIAADPTHRLSLRLAALREIRQQGGDVHIVVADVTDAAALEAAVARIRQKLGPVTDLIHAAGIVADAPIMAKSTTEIEDVLAPKVHGTRNLMHVFAKTPVLRTVLFSSTSTEITAAGQVDYVAANEYLNAVAASDAPGLGHVVAINWGVWSQVGMAVDASLGRSDSPAPVPVAQPLLNARLDMGCAQHFTARFHADDWIIAEHRTRAGLSLLPGTGTIELAAQALEAAGRTLPWRLSNLTFIEPLSIPDGGARDTRVVLSRADDAMGFALEADFGAGFVPVAEAEITAAARVPGRLDIAALQARMGVENAPTGHALPSAQEGQMAFGPRWRVLRATWRSQDTAEGLAELSLPDRFAGDLAQGFVLHPALMDIATGWAMGLIDGYDPAQLWVPLSYLSLTVHRPLPAAVVSHVRLRSHEDGYASFDVTLADPEGTVLVEVEGLTLRRLSQMMSAGLATTPPASHRPAQDRMSMMVAQGIPPELGPRLLQGALGSGRSQIVISSMDLPTLIAQETRTSRARMPGQGQAFDRPNLDSDFIAARTDLERSIAGFFRDLLGVQNVGVNDGFFDLGGHSLIAVRLFAMIRKAYGVDLPLATLFEAPHVEALAKLLEQRIGKQPDRPDAMADAVQALALTAAPRFTHLVPIGQGAAGGGVPLFIVAGMFGNVLNLRALAQRLSVDRPVWGLQARGLFGGEPPHETLAEAAASCVAEMRQIQAQGPYLVAGFSGGGLTALEIARQLAAEGDEIARVVMLDTPVPMRPVLSRQDKLLIRLAEIREEGAGFFPRWLRDKLAYRRARRQALAPQDETGFRNDRIHQAFLGALPRYEMRPWDGPITLYRPRPDRRFKVSNGQYVSTGREYVHEDNLWSSWMSRLVVIEVPGDHDSMVLEPCVRVLAARMRDDLADAERTMAPPRREAAG